MSHNASNDRKASYKVPPAAVRDASTSQEARRKKALEEQKRRRAERFDSSRQLDFFADLTLGASDDEEENATNEPMREGVAQFASLLPSTSSVPATEPGSFAAQPQGPVLDSLPMSFGGPKKKGKNKRKAKSRAPKVQSSKPNNKWADKCMYAELLEMTEDTNMKDFDDGVDADGLPSDIETAWVALTPVPLGKRCLAITHAPSGIAGLVPNTTLRSRVLGKSLMKPFPSAIPPHTVLDCILDEHWQNNGILHVLDVVKWKGQDIADCETPFRFWWRDTRLAELPSFPPPSADSEPSSSQYRFSYPTTLLPVPYHTNLSLLHLSSVLIPLSRSTKSVPISVPIHVLTSGADDTSGMNVEQAGASTRVDWNQPAESVGTCPCLCRRQVIHPGGAYRVSPNDDGGPVGHI